MVPSRGRQCDHGTAADHEEPCNPGGDHGYHLVMRRRPILGFGPAGWAAAALLAALVGAILLGVDLHQELQRLLMFRGSYSPWVYYFQYVHLSQRYACYELPLFGVGTLLYLLPALHVSGVRRLAWRAAVVTAWCLVAPTLWVSCELGGPINRFIGWSFAHASPGLLLGVASCSLLWLVTGSKFVAGATLLPTVAAWIAIDQWNWFSTHLNAVNPGWHGAMAAILLAWAIRSRRAQPPAWACLGCGYDLRGSPGGLCPECGRCAAAGP